RRILAELRADAPEGEVENVCRLPGERLLLASLEQNSELVVAALVERAVLVRLAAPGLELARKRGIARRVLQRVLVRTDGEIDVAFGVRNLPKQARRRRQARFH